MNQGSRVLLCKTHLHEETSSKKLKGKRNGKYEDNTCVYAVPKNDPELINQRNTVELHEDRVIS